MSAIRKLNTGTPSLSDVIAFGSVSDDGDLKCTLETLAGIMQAATSELQTVYDSPVAGETVNAYPSIDGVSVHLLLTPLALLSTLAVRLPANAGHGQEVVVTSTQAISALTVDGNGNAVSVAPSSVGVGGYFRLRYDGVANLWVRVG